jgi:hypothetical protein
MEHIGHEMNALQQSMKIKPIINQKLIITMANHFSCWGCSGDCFALLFKNAYLKNNYFLFSLYFLTYDIHTNVYLIHLICVWRMDCFLKIYWFSAPNLLLNNISYLKISTLCHKIKHIINFTLINHVKLKENAIHIYAYMHM